MVKFLYPNGSVYIFENSEAKRVKVGMTSIGVNDVVDRLRDVNDMWLEPAHVKVVVASVMQPTVESRYHANASL
jgi:hypothetical protein